MARRRNDLPELMPKEVGTKQQVPRFFWKLVQYWAYLAAFLTPKREPLAITGRLILMNCTYWDCDTRHYLMRIKNCHQALSEDAHLDQQRCQLVSPYVRSLGYSVDVLADVERTTHLWILVLGLLCKTTCPLVMIKSIPGLQTLAIW